MQLAGMSDQDTGCVVAVQWSLSAELFAFPDRLCASVDVLNREIFCLVSEVVSVFVSCTCYILLFVYYAT